MGNICSCSKAPIASEEETMSTKLARKSKEQKIQSFFTYQDINATERASEVTYLDLNASERASESTSLKTETPFDETFEEKNHLTNANAKERKE